MLQTFQSSLQPSVGLSSISTVSHVLGSPEADAVMQVWPHQGWAEGSPPRPAGNSSPNASRTSLALFTANTYCWFFYIFSTRTLRSFSPELLFSWLDTTIFWSPGLFLPRSRTWLFPLPNLMRFSSISPICWDLSGWQHNPLVYQSLYNFVSSANLLTVHLCITT